MPLNLDSSSSPLSALDDKGYNVQSFQYPVDLTTDSGEQHFMVFHINESNNTQFPTINPGKTGPTTQAGSFAPQNGSAIPTVNNQPPNANTTWNKRPVSRVSTTIALYFPSTIQTTYNVSWDQANLGIAGTILNKLTKGDQSLTGVGKEIMTQIANSAAHDATSAAKSLVQDAAGDIQAAASLYVRSAVNNHTEMLFRGIDFRKFQFDFKFYPRSEQEALAVDNIINAFKFYASPEIKQGSEEAHFWLYPAEFDIEFWSSGEQNDFINKISTCALTNIGVNYTGAGVWSAFRVGTKHGSPVETHLSLQFTELELITKQRVLQGY